VSDVRDLWVGQNGEKFGPYTEAEVRQWMAEGRFAADALGWRAGMASWEPLVSLLRSEAPPLPPPGERPAAPQPQQRYYARDNMRSDVTLPEPFSAGQPMGDRAYGRDRSTLPTPPSLHWGLVFLFTMLTLGIFGYVWQFIEASWVRKVDPKSSARLQLGLGLTFLVVGYTLQFTGSAMIHTNPAAGGLLSLLGGILTLTNTVLFLVAFYSMAASLRNLMRSYGVTLQTSGVTVFFFNIVYIQALLGWIANWKRTGQTSPPPPKGIIWILIFVPIIFIAILAAIAIPAYVDFTVRTQVMDGVSTSQAARDQVEAFYSDNGRLPKDNAEARLPAANMITDRYVSGVEVIYGRVTVSFNTDQASRLLSGKHLIYKPAIIGNAVKWECKSESNVGYKFLPATCR
jgi:Tfp pilus assembly major pilin PilA